MGQAQLLYIASEIALALLSHPVAAADLCGDFSDRRKCSARMRKACRDQQGRGVTWLVRISREFFVSILITWLRLLVWLSAAAAAAVRARFLLLLMLPGIGEKAARHTLLDG